MDYSMQGNKDSSYSPQDHNMYPAPPPPPPAAAANPQGGYGYQYQGYFDEATANPPYYTGGWREQSAPSFDGGPFHHQYRYHDDADCITFLRGCLAGLCCCCLMGRCCY